MQERYLQKRYAGVMHHLMATTLQTLTTFLGVSGQIKGKAGKLTAKWQRLETVTF